MSASSPGDTDEHRSLRTTALLESDWDRVPPSSSLSSSPEPLDLIKMYEIIWQNVPEEMAGGSGAYLQVLFHWHRLLLFPRPGSAGQWPSGANPYQTWKDLLWRVSLSRTVIWKHINHYHLVGFKLSWGSSLITIPHDASLEPYLDMSFIKEEMKWGNLESVVPRVACLFIFSPQYFSSLCLVARGLSQNKWVHIPVIMGRWRQLIRTTTSQNLVVSNLSQLGKLSENFSFLCKLICFYCKYHS